MQQIPKIFHHIWLGNKPLPDNFTEWIEGWLKLHPGWKVMKWTDENLPAIKNIEPFMSASKMAMKSDILRYELCLNYGGVYIDADFEPNKNIEPILEGVDCFIADEKKDTPCNAILGSKPGNSFMSHLVENLQKSIELGGDIVDMTGPRFIKRSISEYIGNDLVIENAPFIDASGISDPRRYYFANSTLTKKIYSFESSVFYPYYYTEPNKEFDQFPNSYGKHHWTASWWKNGGV